MPKQLVIVESKTKADTIGRFLGRDYTVLASFGHVRDLPKKGLAVDVDHHFELQYAPPEGRSKQVVTDLRRALKDADALYLATDEDREGEAIAWHLLEVLKPKADLPVRRMVFHEITREAIDAALEDTRAIDMRLVEAQEGRRALDRLVGYEVSPVLWRRVGGARSAGRVQSVATRLVVERERERMAFRSAGYWDVFGDFRARGQAFRARLVEVDDAPVADGGDFDAATGRLADGSRARHLREDDARGLAARLDGATYTVASLETRAHKESPKAPFRTSTLQQEAGNKLRYSAGRTMSIAQGLYERGFITYMRTDSVHLSGQAISAARAQVTQRFGPEYLPDAPRAYKAGKNAQEAHEAIRPAGERFRTPDEVRGEMSPDELRLYELIWMRTLASQMRDADVSRVTLQLAATSNAGEQVLFRASGKSYTFLGYRRAYVDVSEDASEDEEEAVLPAVEQGEAVACSGLTPEGHATKPPARYTEASLVRELERRGIGRPSTYASIINTITSERGYVWKKGNALVPSWTAFAKIQLLERHFAHLVDYGFTATMEEALDAVARGEAEVEKWLHQFYFGNGQAGLAELTSQENLDRIDMAEINAIRIGVDPEGTPIIVRVWNTGETLHRGEDKAPLPADLPPDELTEERALELLARGAAGPRELGTDPESGLPVLALTGRYGPFVQLGELVDGSKVKPKRASLFKTMDPETVTLDDALALLALPREVGELDGEVVTAQNGRYGPYLKKGTDSRSLETEEQLLTVTLDEARAIFAQPKLRRGQRARAALAELGPHPETGANVRVLDGRFGPYVTDGTTNATVPRGTDPAHLSLDEAVHLLAERAARGPAKKGARKGAAKKTVKKAAKKSAKKTTKKAAKKATNQSATARPAKATAAADGGAAPRLAAAPGVDEGPDTED